MKAPVEILVSMLQSANSHWKKRDQFLVSAFPLLKQNYTL